MAADDEDWDVPLDKDVDESDSEDEDNGGSSRQTRMNLADAIFGGGSSSAPASRPESRAAERSPSTPPAPPAPPPAAPKAAFVAPPPPADAGQARSALLGQIQGGSRLKKTQTVDKSGPIGAGTVIGGDPTPPPHAPSPEPLPSSEPAPISRPDPDKRQSVDWYSSLASENARSSAMQVPQGLGDAPDETAELDEPPQVVFSPPKDASTTSAASSKDADMHKREYIAYTEPQTPELNCLLVQQHDPIHFMPTPTQTRPMI